MGTKFFNLKKKCLDAVLAPALLILAVMGLASCSSSNSALTGSPADTKATKSGGGGSSFALDLPKDARTGAYKLCQRPQDLVSWKNRKSNVVAQTAQGLVGQYTGQASNVFGTVSLIPSTLMSSSGKSMPVCGNWCGLGHPKPTENPPFVDPLDGACRKHDLCYRKKGVRSCGCDQALADEVLRGRTLTDLNSIELRMVLFFQASPCSGGCKNIMGTRTCASGVSNMTSGGGLKLPGLGSGSGVSGLKLPGLGKVFGR